MQRLIVPLLMLLTASVYGRALKHDFVNFDDTAYVTENNFVQAGLSTDGFRWSLTSQTMGNWHPLTWWTLMLDAQLWGDRAGGFVLTNVVLHTASVLLLYGALRRMTGAAWRSAVVAALFAVHPLHVESVAWVSERKDVLSVFFGMLTLYCYAVYARRPSWRGYALVSLMFLLSLCSKQMLVTLPCVLLLLDFWPLHRWPRAALTKDAPPAGPFGRAPQSLVWEKLPLLALSLALALVVILAQREIGAMAPLQQYPFSIRLQNAILSYAAYVVMTFWPVGLAAYYPHPGHAIAPAHVAAAAGLLIALSLVSVWQARRQPYLLVGWLWFLGTLVPVIGLVQVGSQGLADRYTYFPQVGLLIAVVWGIAELPLAARWRAAGLPTGAIAAVLALAALAFVQVGYWSNSGLLFRHAIDVTRDNFFAYKALGQHEYQQGNVDEAVKHIETALRINPHWIEGHVGIAKVLAAQGEYAKAEHAYRHALALDPRSVIALVNYGDVLMKQGLPASAIRQYRRALAHQPDSIEALNNLAAACVQVKQSDEAVRYYRQALAHDPLNRECRQNLARLLARLGRASEAVAEYAELTRRFPDSVDVLNEQGISLGSLGRLDDARAAFSRALALDPHNVRAHVNMGLALQAQGDLAAALPHFRAALPQSGQPLNEAQADAANNFAWILATCADPQLRDGSEAVRWGRRACQATHFERADYLDTLAAAYAETGDFDQAQQTIEQAIAAARAQRQPALISGLEARGAAYRSGRPHREPLLVRGAKS